MGDPTANPIFVRVDDVTLVEIKRRARHEVGGKSAVCRDLIRKGLRYERVMALRENDMINKIMDEDMALDLIDLPPGLMEAG